MQPTPAPWIYTVTLVIEVDAPHLRDASFPTVPKGHRVTWRVRGSRQECVALYEAAVRGEHDYLSEYVATVAVTASRDGKGRRIKVRVNRATAEMLRWRRQEHLHAEHVAAIRRAVTHEDPAPIAGEIMC